MSPEEIKQNIEKLENIIKESTEQISKLKNSHWAFDEDEKKLECVTISCNFDSWIKAKEDNVPRPFYIECNGKYSEVVDFSTSDAKEIVRYLQEKIEFLES